MRGCRLLYDEDNALCFVFMAKPFLSTTTKWMKELLLLEGGGGGGGAGEGKVF